MRLELLWSFQVGNWGMERLSNLFKAMQLVKCNPDIGALSLKQALYFSLYHICERDGAFCNIFFEYIYSVWRLQP